MVVVVVGAWGGGEGGCGAHLALRDLEQLVGCLVHHGQPAHAVQHLLQQLRRLGALRAIGRRVVVVLQPAARAPAVPLLPVLIQRLAQQRGAAGLRPRRRPSAARLCNSSRQGRSL